MVTESMSWLVCRTIPLEMILVFFAGFAVVSLCPVADGFVLGADVRVMGFEFGLFG